MRSSLLTRFLPVIAILVVTSTVGQAQIISEQTVRIGEPVTGMLSADDGVEPYRGFLADRYVIEATAGQRIEIVMQSDDFDAYLQVEDAAGNWLSEDDDGGGDLNARVVFTVPIDGQYSVLASSYDGETGEYLLLVRQHHIHPIAFEPIRLGRRVRGSLTDTDGSRSDDRYVDGYQFEGSAGQRVHLSLRSDDFDTYLVLLAPTGETLAENDDASRGSSDSELGLQLPFRGTYQVLVTSYQSETGDYVISLEDLVVNPIRNQALALGDSDEGELSSRDGTWPVRTTYADGYTFEAVAGQLLEIDLESDELDCYLIVLGPDGSVVAENDDFGDELHARINMRAPDDGTYRAIATTYSLAEGEYRITVTGLDDQDIEPVALEVGAYLEAYLTESDPVRQRQGGRMDSYSLDLESGQRAIVSMRSEVLNSALWAVAPTGELFVEDDDSGGGLDAMLDITAPFGGRYLIGASTNTQQLGPYTLIVEDGAVIRRADATPIEVGQPAEGSLDRDDDVRVGSGSYRDRYALLGHEGQQLEIRMSSYEIDSYLVLVAPDGVVLAQDDDSGGGLNSQVQVNLPDDGVYTIYATSYRPATGDYSLQVNAYTSSPVESRPLAVGTPVAGRLDDTDARSSRYGTLIDVYDLPCRQGQSVTVLLRSAELDSYLLIIDPNGETVGEDDDSGGALDARLGLTCTMSADYRVLITSTRYGTGGYTVEVTEGLPTGEQSFFRGP